MTTNTKLKCYQYDTKPQVMARNMNLKILCVALFAVAIRVLLMVHPYSGHAKPPMHGDFEAQRHWQEITINLPLSVWYENGTDNDLQYWGLDYPPLTAYHSYLMGRWANYLNSSYVALHASRGITEDSHKLFMRCTVLLADIVVYIPALLLGCWLVYRQIWIVRSTDRGFRLLHVAVALLYPGQILIDNGHFQYNNISLGLAAIAIYLMVLDRVHWGAFAFTLALNYKQMELYHALPVFFYLLSKVFSGPLVSGRYFHLTWLKRIANIGIVVVLTFAILWLPWLTSWSSVLQVLHRIFPVKRGVFEDKVANIWCAVNVVIRIKEYISDGHMAIICMIMTLIFSLPSCIGLFVSPKRKHFLLCLINTSLAFFLFSFQVHEKSILLVTLPVVLYFPLDPVPCFIFLQTATFSMLPLLKQDGLLLAYAGVGLLYVMTIKVMAELLLSPCPGNPSYSWDVLQLTRLFVYQQDNPGGHNSTQSCQGSPDAHWRLNTHEELQLKTMKTIDPEDDQTDKLPVLRTLQPVHRDPNVPYKSQPAMHPLSQTLLSTVPFLSQEIPFRCTWMAVYYGITALQLLLFAALVWYKPPAHLPDLLPLLIALKSAACFICFLAYFSFKQGCHQLLYSIILRKGQTTI